MSDINKSNLRIHPAIGIARVGNSDQYYLGPETMAAEPQEGQTLTGGLPIKPGTESTPITSSDLRDSDGRLKKQAARFKIYQYQDGDTYSYPSKESEEVVIGSTVDGKKVKDIVWTVHLANKKANCWEAEAGSGDDTGINLYKAGALPPLRNPGFMGTSDFNANVRLQKLVIDAGPRAINGATAGNSTVKFDKTTVPSYANSDGSIAQQAAYPILFPASDGTPDKYNATSKPIDYLGEILADAQGRLIVLGGFGLACGFDGQGNPDPNAVLDDSVDNNNWLDDTADGPVTAVLIFEDGSTRALEGSAWVVTTDPSYAPQTLNVVSLWESIYNTWVEELNLQPDLYSGTYNTNYTPSFKDDVFPVFNAAHMQRWNTNLNQTAISGHARIFQLPEVPNPQGWNVLQYIRKPNDPDGQKNGNLQMPLSLGNSGKSFLTVTPTQYFFLEQWWAGKCAGAPTRNLSAGEQLDKTILVNSLGGRFSPGIEATFIVTDTNLYNPDWKNPEIGAFRVNSKALDYQNIPTDAPFLTAGYIPLRTAPVEPGDICKFMAIPWHMDYNSCATHAPDPNPGGALKNNTVASGVNVTLFWSWPAQRPVAVYTYDDLKNAQGNLDNVTQRFSVRGAGTQVKNSDFEPHTPPDANYNGAAMEVGRYQTIRDMLDHWHEIGTIIQGPAIEGYDPNYDPTYYLEVQSQFLVDESNLVQPWRNKVTDKVYPPESDASPVA